MNQFTPLPADRQGEKLAQYFPTGKAWEAASDSDRNLGKLLIGLGQELYRIEVAIELLANEFDIKQTTLLIREWEISVGIPDDCFTIDDDLQQRRDNVLVKIQDLGVRTAQDFIDVAALFGAVVQIEPGAVHGVFPLLFPIAFYDSVKTAKFTMIVDQPGVREVFPILFPIPFSAGIGGIIECLFLKLRPANVQILFKYGESLSSPPFSPDQIADLKLWLDATDTDTIQESGDDVDQWSDKSGQGNHVTASGSARPKTGTVAINGHNALAFDGDDDYFVGSTANEAIILSDHTIFFVAHLNALDEATQCFLNWNGDDGNDNEALFCFLDTTGVFRLIGTMGNVDLIPDNLINTDMLVSIAADYGNDLATRLNGTDKPTVSINAVSSTDSFLIGAEFDAGSVPGNFLHIDAGEIIFYQRLLPQNEIELVETYLSEKWGIVLL